MKKDIGKKPRILILGIGNDLCGDDGFGGSVVRMLSTQIDPEMADIENGGTLGLNLVWLMEDYDIVFVVDSVKGIGKPGQVKRIEWSDMKQQDACVRISLHELGLAEATALAFHAGWKVPKIVIFGVEPKTIQFGIQSLSEEVSLSVPMVSSLILQEVKNCSL